MTCNPCRLECKARASHTHSSSPSSLMVVSWDRPYRSYTKTYRVLHATFYDRSPVSGTYYLEFEWFVPKTGLSAVLKGLIQKGKCHRCRVESGGPPHIWRRRQVIETRQVPVRNGPWASCFELQQLLSSGGGGKDSENERYLMQNQ